MKRKATPQEIEAMNAAEEKVVRIFLDGGRSILYRNTYIFIKGHGKNKIIHVSHNRGATWDKSQVWHTPKNTAQTIRNFRRQVRMRNRKFVAGQVYKCNETHYFTRFNSVDKVVFYKCLGNNKFVNMKSEPVEMREWQLENLQPIQEGDEEKTYNMHVALPARHWTSKYKRSYHR